MDFLKKIVILCCLMLSTTAFAVDYLLAFLLVLLWMRLLANQ